MASSKFKFVSPGVFLNEIDNSQLTSIDIPGRIGPAVIGTSERGPAFLPTQVNSFSEFVELFGNPLAGGGTLRKDQYRDGGYLAPTYAAYAAQAYLRNNTPLTFVRVSADQHAQATTAGAAGWPQDNVVAPDPTHANNAGAFGLFIINSGTAASFTAAAAQTGSLAATWYLKQDVSIRLRGKVPSTSNSDIIFGTGSTAAAPSGSGQMILSTHNDRGFTAIIQSGSVESTFAFDFNPSSPRFIRKVFNTNPILANADIVDQDALQKHQKGYWLGESYEDYVNRNISQNEAEKVFGVIMALGSGTAGGPLHGMDHRFAPRRSKTGWIFSQDVNAHHGGYDALNMQKLFRFESLQHGEWEQKNLKISISNIKAATNDYNEFGTFDVEIRRMKDSDKFKSLVERYEGCNLNPASENYISRKIGDKYREWDYEERRFREYGKYDNASRFIRVEVTGTIDQGQVDTRLLPFGFYGVPRFIGWKSSIRGIGGHSISDHKGGLMNGATAPFVLPPFGNMPHVPFDNSAGTSGFSLFDGNGVRWGYDLNGDFAETAVSGAFEFPKTPLIVSASQAGTTSPKDGYFGIDVFENGSTVKHYDGFVDYLRMLPEGLTDTSSLVETPYYFSLDEVRQSFSAGNDYDSDPVAGALADAFYQSGSRAAGASITANGAYAPLKTTATSSYKTILNAGFDKFTMPLFGGFDGTDITEKDPFRNSLLTGKTEINNYAYNSIRKAIDTVSDPEVVEANIIAVPGLTESTLQDRLLAVCEDRGDALALIDLEGDYKPSTENKNPELQRTGSVTTVIDNLRDRQLNTSYGAAYYPYVQIQDTINDLRVDVPPSVVALGTLGSAETFGELWFAPAGFNRGGLSDGVSGLPVVNVKQKLTSKERDDLYEANINPIASFPTEGIVIFGQKTLQVTQSALDRINVRRLLIFVKKQISRIANNLLFEQNVSATWQRFLDQVNPLLSSIQSRYGLNDFRVVLDETTTTPDLIDRNIMYAKIFLQPARSIEFIAVDFVITNTGAGFQD